MLLRAWKDTNPQTFLHVFRISPSRSQVSESCISIWFNAFHVCMWWRQVCVVRRVSKFMLFVQPESHFIHFLFLCDRTGAPWNQVGILSQLYSFTSSSGLMVDITTGCDGLNPTHPAFFSNDDDSISAISSMCFSIKAKKIMIKQTQMWHNLEKLPAASSSDSFIAYHRAFNSQGVIV